MRRTAALPQGSGRHDLRLDTGNLGGKRLFFLYQVRVASVTGRLVAAVARVLPTRERPRYADEFGSELW
jgi:hypothetical protein